MSKERIFLVFPAASVTIEEVGYKLADMMLCLDLMILLLEKYPVAELEPVTFETIDLSEKKYVFSRDICSVVSK